MKSTGERYYKFLGIIASLLFVAQVVLVLLSWLISSAVPSIHVRSLLNSEGVRWFFGRFTDNLSAPILVWMVLLTIAVGALRASGLLDVVLRVVKGDGKLLFRERFSLWVVVAELIVVVGLLIALTSLHHPILLSSTGHLFPSPFSRSLVPVVAFAVTLSSLSFGIASRRTFSFASAMRAVTSAFRYAAPYFVIYVLAAQLFHTVLFVFFL
jgi:aminobenzoyl-glutamate transport protein